MILDEKIFHILWYILFSKQKLIKIMSSNFSNLIPHPWD